MLICLDDYAQVRDIYFPHVGLENHVGPYKAHKVGVWVDGKFAWLDNDSWNISVDCEKGTLACNTRAYNDNLQIELHLNDVVYNEKNIFIRKVDVTNKSDLKRVVKLYFYHQFGIYGSEHGDTAYYDPKEKVLIHYKGRRNFLLNAVQNDKKFDDFTIGVFGIEGKEGSFRDAEDGSLSGGTIEHGKVDSVMGFTLNLKEQQTESVYYWMTVAKHMRQAYKLNDYVIKKTPSYLIRSTKNYWNAWVNKQNFSFYGLDPGVEELFKKSLVYIRSHVSANGSVLASGDSDMLHHGRDTYSYMWPRDGAYVSIALSKAGDLNGARRFFEFCRDVITEEGYFLHKYRPDKSLGSSWHPWYKDGKAELPIQEDETAMVIYALWEYYRSSKDLEFIEDLYNTMIKSAAEFMCEFRFNESLLPRPTYDLWEEKHGVHTYTCASVVGALTSAAYFAETLGKVQSAEKYKKCAEQIKNATLKHLYDTKENVFFKSLNMKDRQMVYDKTLDISSIFGIYKFGLMEYHDERLKQSVHKYEEILGNKAGIKGYPRYEADWYYRVSNSAPPNPWFVTTLWIAQYYIGAARSDKDLDPVKEWINWTLKHAGASGILSEQLNPYDGVHVSATPLTWSHAEFVTTVILYLEKLEELGISKANYKIEKL